MLFETGELVRDGRRKIRFKAALLHDFFGGGLQVEIRRVGSGHELPKWNRNGIQATTNTQSLKDARRRKGGFFSNWLALECVPLTWFSSGAQGGRRRWYKREL